MARIVVGSYGGSVTLKQVQSVLAAWADSWPDLSVTQRTFSPHPGSGSSPLLGALSAARIGIAVQALETVPLTLPEGLTLAAVCRRLEARSALVAPQPTQLRDLGARARVGVETERDRAFLQVLRPELELALETPSDLLIHLRTGELGAAVLSAAAVTLLGERHLGVTLLEADVFLPNPGQGALGLIIREDDDLAAELAYTLQHRPSFVRVQAERAFARTLADSDLAVGSLAITSGSGELTLTGAAVRGERLVRAHARGLEANAETLGREVAKQVREQL